jgi:hypothetical protein
MTANRLGLLLGGAVLLLIVGLMFLFKLWGMPKDGKAWARQQQIESIGKP